MTRDTYLEMIDKLENVADDIEEVARNSELSRDDSLKMAGAIWDIYEVRSDLEDPGE